MTGALLQFVISGAAIVLAGTVLTRCADAIAEATGLGRLLVGSILVASATSLPELLVDLNAILRERMPDLAVGDLLGSSVMNLLILGVVDLLWRERGVMLSRRSAAHALSATTSILLTVLVVLSLLRPSRTELLGAGVGVWVVAGVYLLGVRLSFFDQRLMRKDDPDAGGRERPLLRPILGFAASAVVLFFAAPFLANAAGRIADLTGLGTTFVGTTMVALATSLPELTSTIVALRIGAPDLAIGNLFGSNAFNMLLLLPLDLAWPGALLAAVSPDHAITGLAA
ncbi:MAG TPA: sodium:calcium antiporter, partial [Planctomycetota bacterium]|nr:sodium:calcium antiporter [Planctomycetota bacterium]